MLGIDTNVLVRFLVRDNETQFEKARKLIKREVAAGRRVFVSQLVLLALVLEPSGVRGRTIARDTSRCLAPKVVSFRNLRGDQVAEKSEVRGRAKNCKSLAAATSAARSMFK